MAYLSTEHIQKSTKRILCTFPRFYAAKPGSSRSLVMVGAHFTKISAYHVHTEISSWSRCVGTRLTRETRPRALALLTGHRWTFYRRFSCATSSARLLEVQFLTCYVFVQIKSEVMIWSSFWLQLLVVHCLYHRLMRNTAPGICPARVERVYSVLCNVICI